MQIDVTPEFLASQGLSPTFPERFWSKVFIMTEGRGCWFWTAHVNADGYGRIWAGRRGDAMILAHVASFIINKGPVPVGKLVMHSCDTPPCVNPHHLFPGTDKENTRDALSKGRLRPLRGERNPIHKLTECEVRTIRSLYEQGGISQKNLGVQFNVSERCVHFIVLGQHWKHI